MNHTKSVYPIKNIPASRDFEKSVVRRFPRLSEAIGFLDRKVLSLWLDKTGIFLANRKHSRVALRAQSGLFTNPSCWESQIISSCKRKNQVKLNRRNLNCRKGAGKAKAKSLVGDFLCRIRHLTSMLREEIGKMTSTLGYQAAQPP